jgi:hypothetical protein
MTRNRKPIALAFYTLSVEENAAFRFLKHVIEKVIIIKQEVLGKIAEESATYQRANRLQQPETQALLVMRP